MSEVFHVGYSRILVIGVVLSLFCSGCQSTPPLTEKPVEVERTAPSTPTQQEPNFTKIPVKNIAEIAKDLELDTGFVLAGAYVLTLEPTVAVEGHWTYGTIGYLPVGRIVFLDSCDTPIKVYLSSMNQSGSSTPREEKHTYCRIITPSGLEGLVRADRVVRLEGPVAIATGDAEISVFAESPDSPPSKSIGRFSRTSGTYVEILAESTEYFRVRMPWSTPKDTEGLLMRTTEATPLYDVVDETRREAVPVSFQSAVDNATDHIEEISGLPLGQIVESLSNHFDLGQDVGLENLPALMCRLDADAFADIGFSALGSGAGISAHFKLWAPGFSYDYDVEVMKVGDTKLRTFAMVKRLECNGSQPDRMDSFGIVGKPSFTADNEFLFEGGEEDNSLIRQIGRQVMFTIDGDDGYYDFEKIQRTLESKARDNNWLKSLEKPERRIILDHILRKVTYISTNAR